MTLEDTWFAIDLPVLEKTVALLESQPIGLRDTDVAEAVDRPVNEVRRSLHRLEGEYVEMRWAMRGPGELGRIVDVSPDARRVVGQWPSAEGLADRLLAELDDRVDAAGNEAERSRWVKIRDGFAGAGRDVLVDVLGTAVSRSMGGL